MGTECGNLGKKKNRESQGAGDIRKKWGTHARRPVRGTHWPASTLQDLVDSRRKIT